MFSIYSQILNRLDKTLIISCQALSHEPLHGSDIMARMALAAQMGGASFVRGNGPADIAAIKKTVPDLCIIGINKADPHLCDVFITPTLEHALAIIDAGADIVAMDCTNRKNLNGEYGRDLIAPLKKQHDICIMAETSTVEEAILAHQSGADILATTLSGYTPYSRLGLETPDFELIAEIRAAVPTAFINAEGRFETPEQVLRAFALGANCVTIGTAITRPQAITKNFFDKIKGGTTMSTAKRYFDFLQAKMSEIVDNELEHIHTAASLITESCNMGGRFYVFGSGHSHMVAEELYIRAGGLAYVKAILPPELMLHEMPNKSTYLERLEGYSEAMVNLYKLDSKDTLMVISNSGRNPVPVEMCLAAKAKGTKVIALTAMKHAANCTSRHSSGKNIYQIADVTIDNGAEKGDAAFIIDGLDTPVGPTSDATGIAIAQALMAEVVDNLVKAGKNPPVFKSSNVDGADAYNDELFNKYYGYWK